MTVENYLIQNQEKYLKIKDSIQDKRVNKILDKILIGKKLNKDESNFLKKFDTLLNYDLKDYSHLSKNMTVDTVKSFLEKKIKVICDLSDRNGKLNDEIISIENNFEENKCLLNLKHGESCYLFENFLYNLTYNINKNLYSLTTQDEYFEKITIENED